MSFQPAAAPAYHDPHTAPAFRVASAIGVVKWIVVGVHALVAVVAFLGGALSGSATILNLAIPLVSGIGALVAWVMFGWAQHTLGMLATVARNTAR